MMARLARLSADAGRARAAAGGADPAAAESAAMAADSRTVAGWTLVSRITGFGRVATMAAVLGPTYFGNLFQTANYLPYIVHEILTGSLITAMLVPPLVRFVDAGDDAARRRLANGFLGVAVLAFAAVTLLGIVLASPLVELITMGVADPAVRAQQHRVGWPLIAMVMPQVICYGIAATGMAVQHAHRRFALAAAAPAFENFTVMAVMATSAVLFGVGTALDEVSTPQLLLLGLGTTAAAAVQAGVQWWGAYRAGVPLLPGAGWRDPDVRRVLRLAVPSSVYASLNAANYLGLLVAAGGIPGGAVAIQIGINFFGLPVAIGAKPVASAQLPRLARSFNQESLEAFQAIYRRSLGLAMFVALPSALLFVAVPEIMAHAVSYGDMATAAGLTLVTACIASLGPGILGEAAFIVSTSASYARRDARSPLQAMALRAAITFCGIALAVLLMSGVAMLWVLGIGFSLANIVAAIYLHGRQVRALPPPPAARRWPWAGDLLIGLVALAPSLIADHWLNGVTLPAVGRLLLGAAAIAASGGVYLAIQWARGSEELAMLLARIGEAAPVPAAGVAPAAAPGAGVARREGGSLAARDLAPAPAPPRPD